MLSYLVYLFALLRLRVIISLRKLSSRFDIYSAKASFADEQATGVKAADSDWLNACPNLERKENVLLVASNSFDKTALKLSLKWRPSPDGQVGTLVTRLSLELDGISYEHDTVRTYKPTESSLYPGRITQYGSNGSSLKLFVLDPLRRYRLLFRGSMKRRDAAEETRFVKLNCIIFMTSKVYDFRSQFDAHYLAEQYASKPNRKCSISEILDRFVLLDRFEQSVRFHGELVLRERDAKLTRKTIYLWGFHSRQFVSEREQSLRSKRILGHFANGRMFQLAACEDIEHIEDPNMRFTSGYGCFRIGAAIGELNGAGEKEGPVDWGKIGGSTSGLSLQVAAQEHSFRVEGSRRAPPSEFFDLSMVDGSPEASSALPARTATLGWGCILINDSFDTSEEQFRLDKSLRDYRRALEAGQMVDPDLFLQDSLGAGQTLVVDIAEKECQYPSLVGSKASSLAQLRAFSSVGSQADYLVPEAVVLTRFAYELIQRTNPNLSDSIKRLEARVGRGDLHRLDKECERLQEYFRQEVQLPAELRLELERKLRHSFALHDIGSLDGKSFAVRSSSWGEDEDDMSAAGQLTTILKVASFEKLLEAILECYSSKFGHTNIEYKRQHGLPLDLPMAVVVQEMVDCEKAGVVFTCEPTLGDESQLVITANFGLGESVVSGQADPDTIRVAVLGEQADGNQPRRVEISELKVGQKRLIIPAGQAGPEQEEQLNTLDRSKCCLAEDEILKLSRCCLDLVAYFDGARDIEWGWKAGRLYLLQSRPITGLDAYTDHELLHESDMASRAELEFATRANVGEVMPFAISPLGMSYALSFWPVITEKIFGAMQPRRQEDYCLGYSPDFIFQAYHTFFGLRGKTLISFAGEPEKRPLIARAMEIGLFGHEVNDQQLSERATEMVDNYQIRFQELKFAYHTWRTRYTPFKLNREAKKRLARLRRDIHSLRYAGKAPNQMEGLRRQLKAIYVEGHSCMVNHMIATFISSKMNFALMQLLSRYCENPTQLYSALSKILSSCPDVLSAQIPRRINKMAKLIAKSNDQVALEEFVAMSPKEALKFVSRDLKSELAKEFDEFMVSFGHRCYNEFEISSVSWRDKPEEIVENIQANVRPYIGKRPEDIDDGEPPKKTMEQLIDSLGIKLSWSDRARLKYLLAPRCQMFVSVREQTKDIMIEFCDIQRDATRLLARELRQNNRIPDEELLYFINYSELDALTRQAQPWLVMQAAKRRKVFKRMFDGPVWRFEEIIRGYEMLPVHLKEAKELDEKVKGAQRLHGTTASSGQVRAKVCIVHSYDELKKVEPGDILVTHSTDIAFSPIFPLLSGVVTEIGGLISHGAVVAREYGLPSVIGVDNATNILKHGEQVLLDADNGTIVRLSLSGET